MSWKPKPVPIAGDLRTRINQIAHAAGQRHALKTKELLTEALRTKAADGARLDDLHAELDRLAIDSG